MSKKSKDPFYKKEKEKYEFPIPSREFILQILEDYGRPVSRNKLNTLLEAREEDLEALGFRLKAMVRDGQIMQDRTGRFCLLKRINLCRGVIHGHPEGYGFFIPEEGGEDMLLSPKEMQAAMHGDVALAIQTGTDRRGRAQGKIHEIIEHANQSVVGRFFTEHGVGFVIPDNKRLTQDICVPLEMAAGAKNAQMVLLEIVAFPTKRNQAIGKVVHILGDHMAPGMETEVAIFAHHIPAKWPEVVLEEAAKISQRISAKELEGRSDFRHLPFVTIDGETAKDFDDAVYCYKKPKGGFQLFVAIADVSHYVQPNSDLDKEAVRRGNSVYFPSQVVPMLPESLSNGICSLNPKVDRLVMVAEMAISTEGKLTRSRFYRAVIHSHARLTYTQVAKWLNNNGPEKSSKESYEKLWPHIESLNNLYRILLSARKKRGAIEFDTTETYIEFDKKRKIKRIVPITRNDAHRLIEECMLIANVATAKFLESAEIPSLYRIHALPDEDKITALQLFLEELSIKLPGGKKPRAKDFQKTIEGIKDRAERHLIEMVMLRSLKQAQYCEENIGHFGLAYPAYTHFTSPIRRYPDLLIHRAIGHLIDKKSIESFCYSSEDISRMGRHCSTTERRADEAVREVVAWLKCEYMQDKIGQIFEGKISAVTGFGIFVQLDSIYVEGLVHITSLRNDYYAFDPIKHRLRGERTGQTYRLGDRVSVLVARVDLDERKIDLEPAEVDSD